MAAKEIFSNKIGCTYAVTFKKYEKCHRRFIDDLVNFVMSGNERESSAVNCDVTSGFTPAIGKLVKRLLRRYRDTKDMREAANKCFENKNYNSFSKSCLTDNYKAICEIVDKCENEKYDFLAETYMRDKIAEFGAIYLKNKSRCSYYVFFATICALCLKVSRTKDDFLVPIIKQCAMDILDNYWLTFPGCDKLNQFAEQFLFVCEEVD